MEERLEEAKGRQTIAYLLQEYMEFRKKQQVMEAVQVGTVILNKLKTGEPVQCSDLVAMEPEQRKQMFAYWMATDADYLFKMLADEAVNGDARRITQENQEAQERDKSRRVSKKSPKAPAAAPPAAPQQASPHVPPYGGAPLS